MSEPPPFDWATVSWEMLGACASRHARQAAYLAQERAMIEAEIARRKTAGS